MFNHVKKLSLASILLPALVIPFIMNYRISPQDTPYWLFGIIFFLLVGYVILDVVNLKENLHFKLKTIFLWSITAIVICSAFVSTIIVRHQTAPTYLVHDIVIQQESAIRFLLHGKNPYSVTYFGTPLEQWHYSDTEINPALYHFVMEPFYLIFAIPFYLVSSHTIGFFDGRIPLIFLFFVSLFVAWKIPKEKSDKFLFVTLLAFNPAILPYTLEGRSDIFMFAFLLVSLAFLLKEKLSWSAFFMALAFAVKQSVWLAFPFYAYLIFKKTGSLKKSLKPLFIFLITFSVIVLPFLVWDPKAFIDSTILYLSGNASHSYPVSGYGFGMVLNQAGIIKDIHNYFPFIIIQLALGVPLLIVLFKFLKNKINAGNMMFAYGVFLFIYWYFSRYFNNSHIAYISLIFISSYFLLQNE